MSALGEAARVVIRAAWTDRHSRLHGHPAVGALEAAMRAVDRRDRRLADLLAAAERLADQVDEPWLTRVDERIINADKPDGVRRAIGEYRRALAFWQAAEAE